MAQQLAQKLWLAVDISSGANLVGAIQVQEEMGADAVVVTVFSDDNKKYMSTDLMKEEPVKADYITPHVELLHVETIKRVCNTCCDLDECNLNPGNEQG